jgi:retinol dehydrogenase-12
MSLAIISSLSCSFPPSSARPTRPATRHASCTPPRAYTRWRPRPESTGPAKRGHSTTLLYNQSKLANILVVNSLHRSHFSSVVSVSVHPGLIRSQLGRHSPAFPDRMLDKLRWPAELGAVGLLFAGTSARSEELGGRYVIPWGRVGDLNSLARDEGLQDRLEAWLREEVKAWL